MQAELERRRKAWSEWKEKLSEEIERKRQRERDMEPLMKYRKRKPVAEERERASGHLAVYDHVTTHVWRD